MGRKAVSVPEQKLPKFKVGQVVLRLSDGRILDPTADQFVEMKLPPIYIGPPLSIYTTPATPPKE
jgi:hypothetical protein